MEYEKSKHEKIGVQNTKKANAKNRSIEHKKANAKIRSMEREKSKYKKIGVWNAKKANTKKQEYGTRKKQTRKLEVWNTKKANAKKQEYETRTIQSDKDWIRLFFYKLNLNFKTESQNLIYIVGCITSLKMCKTMHVYL